MAKEEKSAGSETSAIKAGASGDLEDKIAAANALGALTQTADLANNDRRQAHDILATLSRDAEQQVRTSVARAIADYPFLPPAIAEQLASDVSEVSTPMLRRSPVLTDAFLADLIDSGAADEQAQVSIATRQNLTEKVSGPLLKSGERRAVETVLSNESAMIDNAGYDALFARDDLDGRMLTLVSAREGLTIPVVAECHRLILTDRFDREVGALIRQQLIRSYALPPQMADAIVCAALEDSLSQATADIGATASELTVLAESLHSHQDITPSLLLRMTCNGSLEFTVAAFHVLTGRPREEIASIFGMAGTDRLAALYRESQLPSFFRFALITAIKRMMEEHQKNDQTPSEKPIQDIIRDIVGFYRGIAPTSLEQVITRLCHEGERWAKDSRPTPSQP